MRYFDTGNPQQYKKGHKKCYFSIMEGDWPGHGSQSAFDGFCSQEVAGGHQQQWKSNSQKWLLNVCNQH